MENRANTGIIKLPASVKLTNVTEVDNGGKGNCFFYAIHGALSERPALLDTVCACLKLPKDKEGFNIEFRKVIAEDPETKQNFRDFIDGLINSIVALNTEKQAKNTITVLTAELSTEFKDTLRTSIANPYEFLDERETKRDKIVTKLCEHIKTNFVYVSDPETEIAKRKLAECGIYLDIKRRSFPQLQLFDNRIVLRNIDGWHYQYFSFITPGGGSRSRRNHSTRRNRRNRTRPNRRNTRRN